MFSVVKPVVATLSEDAVAQFSAGYLYSIIAKDKRDYIVDCFNSNDELNTLVNEAITNEAKGDVDAALNVWRTANSLKDPFRSQPLNCFKLDQLHN